MSAIKVNSAEVCNSYSHVSFILQVENKTKYMIFPRPKFTPFKGLIASTT